MKASPRQTKQARTAASNPRRANPPCRFRNASPGSVRELWLEGLFTHSADAIYIHDLQGRMLDVNPAACETFGYTREELLTLRPWELATHISRPEMLHLWQEVKCGWRVTVERSHRRKDGGQVLGEARLTRACSPEGDVIIAVCRDMTARRRVEEALLASEQLARGQVEALRHALDAVAREAAPNRFLDEVLRTMCRMLRAHGLSLWLQDEEHSATRFVRIFPAHKKAASAFGKNGSTTNEPSAHPLVADLLCHRKPVLCDDLERDPRFELNRGYWLAGGVRSVLAVPLLAAGQVLGMVSLSSTRRDGYRPDEIELAQALAHQAALAVQLSRLATAGLQAAVLEERNRIARDIHDTLAQGFTGTVLQLEAAQDALASNRLDDIAQHLAHACKLARESLRQARCSVQALRNPALLGSELTAVFDDLFQLMTSGTRLQAIFACTGETRRLPSEWQEHLLHIGREALTNTLKHAQARRFAARLCVEADEIRFDLTDDGRGFDPGQTNGGFGLTGMRERAERMGGRLLVDSALGEGTGIRVALPAPAS